MTRTVAERVLDYFERQCAHYQALIAFLETVPAAVAAGDLETVEAGHDAHVRTGQALNDECAALLAEWQAAHDVPPASQSAVRARAAEAHGLVVRAELAYRTAAQALDSMRGSLSADQGRLRRGREMLHRYRLVEGGGGYIDRQA